MKDKVTNSLRYMEERRRVSKSKMMMNDELYWAAMKADVQIFNNVAKPPSVEDVANFTSKTQDGSNIIHIAVRHAKPETLKFINKALNFFPQLISILDSNGDTVAHLAAKCKTDFSANIIRMYCQRKEHKDGIATNPWAVKNYKGSLAIYEALKTDNLKVAKILLEISEFVSATRINDLEETLLHAYARYGSPRSKFLIIFYFLLFL